MPWAVTQLDATHHVAAFNCGEASLNSFLQKYAHNNARAGLGRTFVAARPGQTRVLGYFTVSTGSVKFDAIPDHVNNKLPKYPIPTVHIGRLAVDAQVQGQGLGETLLVEAIRRAAEASNSVGVYAIDVIALHERARKFYLNYSFVEMLDQPLHLFLGMQTARALAAMI